MAKKMIPCTKEEVIDHIQKDIASFKERFSKMPDDVRDIRNALLGTEYNKEDGLVYKILQLEKRMGKVERFQYKLLVWSMVIVGVVTFGFKIYESIKR